MRPPLLLRGLRTARRSPAAAFVGLLLAVAVASPASAAPPDLSKTACVYTNHSISELDAFSAMVGRRMSCAMVYNDAVTTWQQWESPWFINDHIADNNWSAWATAPGTSRRLVITQDLVPSELVGQDWLDAGASGAYTQYATTLAENLVSAGLGNAIIRLAPEANGTWFADSLGSTPAQWALWDRFWDVTVEAMRSVPGAHFEFDWCVSAMYRNLPLAQIYPGSQDVDIIGVDVYDDGNIGTTGTARWSTLMNAGDGLGQIVSFAAAQGKPISIPEWGVNTVAGGGFGDDPTFVQGIASLVASHPTAYQSYFYKYGQQTQLAPGTQSLAAYQAAFGANGYALGNGAQQGAATPPGTTSTPAAPSAPPPPATVPPATTRPVTVTRPAPTGTRASKSTRRRAGRRRARARRQSRARVRPRGRARRQSRARVRPRSRPRRQSRARVRPRSRTRRPHSRTRRRHHVPVRRALISSWVASPLS
ncbi:MAG TPA: glycosyl hydrolase [Solirubrobacteraceae bacterium]|nr:glycosyl hydrolase [Solirubrobacteraceae bacterium]